MSIVSPSELVGDVAIAKLADLFSKQIKAAMDEERAEIAGLSQHLLNAHTLATNSMASNTKEQADQQAMFQEMGAAMAKLQFADRLSQRLLNVANNLEQLGSFLSEHNGKIDQHSWEEILDKVNFHFSMESERQLLDEIIGVAAVHDEKDQNKETIPELF